jgi:ATP-dependent DNA ligase
MPDGESWGPPPSPMNLPFQPPITPMKAKHVASLPTGEGWQFEPKWDGFRAVAFRDGDQVFLGSRNELPLGRYFPEVLAALGGLRTKRFVLDGEVVRFTDDGKALDFDALQLRLHPAESRVRRLSNEIPASFIVFDILAEGDDDLRNRPLRERRARLEKLMKSANGSLHLSPRTEERPIAEKWLQEFVVQGLDGVVAKRLDAPYRPGERDMLKVKRERTADCVVAGFRWAKDQHGGAVGSLLLGLYGPDGELWQVGFTSGFTREARRDLVAFLEPYREGTSEAPPPGIGAQSRWAQGKDLSYERVRPELVCEVAFDQVTGHRIRHGARFLRWRPDKPPAECTFDELTFPANVNLKKLLA